MVGQGPAVLAAVAGQEGCFFLSECVCVFFFFFVCFFLGGDGFRLVYPIFLF